MSKSLLFEIGAEGRIGHSLPRPDPKAAPISDRIPERFLRKTPPDLPELSEPDVIRHYVRLSTLNHHVDKGFYPLGSCTMKYNPKVNENTSRFEGLADLHPFQEADGVQGALGLMEALGRYLCAIAGMDAITLQPAAGAHGEMTGIKIIRAYHEDKGSPRKKIILPDSAHGTNPASATISGFHTVQIKSGPDGLVDIDDLASHLDDETAALMLTNPNTLGLFESRIAEIADLVHRAGALFYMDGANLNALLGVVRPGDIGFDVMHFNLHKTFSTPHGGGGPGSGPVGVKSHLADFLPIPIVVRKHDRIELDWDRPKSVGKIQSFFGNFGIMVRAYTYLRMMGEAGLQRASESAIINANYLLSKLKQDYLLPFKQTPMHEFVLSADTQKALGVRALDVAKRLLDFGFHAPTVYFPLIVHEAMMIEPTETESMETLDAFAKAMIAIAREAESDPERLHQAPVSTPVRRLDEALAARLLDVKHFKQVDKGS